MIFAPYRVCNNYKNETWNAMNITPSGIELRSSIVFQQGWESNLAEPFLLASMAEPGKFTWFNFK